MVRYPSRVSLLLPLPNKSLYWGQGLYKPKSGPAGITSYYTPREHINSLLHGKKYGTLEKCRDFPSCPIMFCLNLDSLLEETRVVGWQWLLKLSLKWKQLLQIFPFAGCPTPQAWKRPRVRKDRGLLALYDELGKRNVVYPNCWRSNDFEQCGKCQGFLRSSLEEKATVVP